MEALRRGRAHFAGRTWICMKLPCALTERTSITVFVCGLRTPADGVAFTRPLCPYPQVARYKGTGSVDDAANFVCRAPAIP